MSSSHRLNFGVKLVIWFIIVFILGGTAGVLYSKKQSKNLGYNSKQIISLKEGLLKSNKNLIIEDGYENDVN